MFEPTDLFDDFTGQPVTYTWVIDNFNRTTECTSPQIELPSGSVTMHLRSRAYMISNQHRIDRASISFVSTTEKIISIYFRLSLINEKGAKCCTSVGSSESKPDTAPKLYTIQHSYLFDKASGLVPDGKLTVYFEIFDLDNAEHTQSGIHRGNLFALSRNNQSLLDSGKLSDVVLVVGKREFKAHKLILSTRSMVFEKMFEHDMEESKRNRVEIEDMSAGAVEELLKFIYTGKVGHLEQHVYELYAAADKYQIDSLKCYCDHYLRLSLTTSTVTKVLQLADLYSLEDLKSVCIDYVNHHSAEFAFDDWKELTTYRPGLMFQVFQSLATAKLDNLQTK